MADRAPVEAIFVDLDNTLIDTDSALGEALIAAFSHVGAKIPDGAAERIVTMWWADPGGWYKRYEAGEINVTEQRRSRFLDVAAVAGVAADVFDEWQLVYVDSVVSQTRLFDDAIAFLRAVEHVPVIVVTNVESAFQRRKIAHAGLSERLPHVVGADLVERAKPDPALFEIACSRAGVAPEHAVHIGDSWDADVTGARNSGIRAVWLDRGEVGHAEPLPNGVTRVTSLTEVPARLGMTLSRHDP